MEEFISRLVDDKTLTNDIKLQMLKNYETKWFESMCTTTQSKEELIDHNESLKVIQDAIKKLN